MRLPHVVARLRRWRRAQLESISGSDASVVGGRHFDAFGDARGTISAVVQEPYGYTGQEQDPELGLVNMHGRMYDPRLGQFLSPDPQIQSPYGQGLNRFAYVFNSPMNFSDPSGFTATESYWEAGLGLGVPFTAGLIATAATSGSSGAAVVGAEAAAATHGALAPAQLAPATATAMDDVGAIAGPIQIATAVINLAVASGNQPVHHFKPKPRSTHASGQGPKTARPNANSPASPRNEKEPACNAECRNASPAGLGPPVNHGVLNEALPQIPDTHEMYDEAIGGVLQISMVVFPPGALLGLGASAAAARAGAGVGKTVIGHLPEYVEKAAKLGARRFNIPTSVWNKMSSAEQWAANTKFLDRMIARGDEIILATRAGQARAGSFFARELEYLASKGYTPSADGLRMLAP